MRKVFLSILFLTMIAPAVSFSQNFQPENETSFSAEQLQQIQNLRNTVLTPDIQEKVTLAVNPSIPRPNQLVTVTVQSTGLQLDRLMVRWYLNGEPLASGIGLRKQQFTMGNIGQQTRITVKIEKNSQDVVERNFTFRPAEVDLVYEAETFTPPFYLGKAQNVREGSVRFIALPQVIGNSGQYVRPENLIYKWSLNDRVHQDASGYGKQYFDYTGRILSSSITVGVEISTIDDGVVASHRITLGVVNPEIVLYEKSPTLGTLYNKNIFSLFYMTKQEIEFEAVPYFFDLTSVFNLTTVYDWFLNGQKINSPNQNTMVFRNENNESGLAAVRVQASNQTMFQRGENSLNLIFEENTGSNFFSF